MTTTFRTLDRSKDIEGINSFLSDAYRPDNRDGNWLQPMWDYSCYHPLTDPVAQAATGVWEADSRIVGTAIFDLTKGNVALCTRSEYAPLKSEMLQYVESHLGKGGQPRINFFVHDFDTAAADVASRAGFARREEADKPLYGFRIPSPFPEILVADGFLLSNLEEHNDLRRIHRLLHRGFNHSGEPPEDELASRKIMRASPHYRPDLTSVTVAPSGDYASYCGMWLDEANRYCYVEPVATDPDYRRLGLGSAVVLDSIRKSAEYGAELAYVWSDQAFYQALGFTKLTTHECWTKELTSG
jgi:predicted N-acetyltransferase YhbS